MNLNFRYEINGIVINDFDMIGIMRCYEATLIGRIIKKREDLQPYYQKYNIAKDKQFLKMGYYLLDCKRILGITGDKAINKLLQELEKEYKKGEYK